MDVAMDDGENQTQAEALAPAAESQPRSQGEEDGEKQARNEGDKLIANAQKLMEKITSSPENPSPFVLHALASILETQESRYMEEHDPSSNSGRSSHNIGRLGNLIRENDDFFELISSKFLSETRYPTPIQAAAARLLLSCSQTWTYPHVFEEAVLENIKNWVIDDTARFPGEHHNCKSKKASNYEMLKSYSTGLLAVCLASGGQVVEDVLTSGLSAKLMRYLRVRVLGETSSQKDATHLTEGKIVTGSTCTRDRDEGRGRVRQALETNYLDDLRIADERSLDGQSLERDQDRSIVGQGDGEECWVNDREPTDALGDRVDTCEVDADGEVRRQSQELRDGKAKLWDFDENGRDDSSRRRVNRGSTRSRCKGRVNEGGPENEQVLTSPGSGIRLGQGRSTKDRSSSKHLDVKKLPDARKTFGRITSDVLAVERDDNDDCFQECRVGSKDISDMVKKAVIAAEAEARAANAPEEAIKAAGDAAAEVVKSAAFEEFKSTSDEEAAVLAASRAACTVIDASNSIEVSRSSSSINDETMNPRCTETGTNEDVEEYFILDSESLAQLREKYCIQCLEILGEYVEVLGPVLHEKGVDVCLSLFQRSSRHNEGSKVAILLTDVMKLICALAAHRKFAALFVDRGGMQKLLAVPRDAQTFFGLSSCLFTIGSLQGIMERVCALPLDVIHQLVELAIQLLECNQDQARKNAALFFAATFVFRAVLDAFDAQDGLHKLLRLLNDAASVRSGVNTGALGFSSSGSFRNDRSPAEVLTSSEKQIAYHTCVALRQYFRAHLLLLVDSIRPNKNNRSTARNTPSIRAAYKPLDISNEAMDAVFLQLQKDRKLVPAFVRTRWPVVEKFLSSNGHIILLELCQAPPVERYLHDLLQYALGVLHIVTLVPNSRKMIVSATLSNNRVGIAVILDAANSASSYVDPEIIQPALNVLVNLVCPPPAISNKPPLLAQGQHSVSSLTPYGPTMENRDRNTERNISDRAVSMPSQSDSRERNGESSMADRLNATGVGTQFIGSTSQTPVATATSGLVGDRRISLGAGAGCAGLATQLELGYRQAREAVRANNGIKVLLHLLQPRIYSPPAALDCLRALSCRVLLGLARDDTIAHILTKLQVGKKLSELIRDSGSQTSGTEQGRWQVELSQAAIELIAIVTNSGRASTLAATDAATPTLRRIERAAIAAATPITYHSRELLLLIHEHLQASGLGATATALLKEAQLTPLPSLAAPSSLAHQTSTLEAPYTRLQWPSGRAPCGFLTKKSKFSTRDEDTSLKFDSNVSFSKKKLLGFSPSFGLHSRNQLQFHDSQSVSARKVFSSSKQSSAPAIAAETQSESLPKPSLDTEYLCKTPIILPMKRKLSELKDVGSISFSGRRLHTVGSHSGGLEIFDSNSNNVLESCTSHQSPLTFVESYLSGETQLLLSSSSQDVRLWDASSISGGPMHPFEGCKAARFSNSGSIFAALTVEPSPREILLYNIQTCQLESKLSDTSASSTGRGHIYSLIHFSPSDAMLLWNGVLWDRRVSGPVHRFDQFTDYGGGGFHPAGNEVIINSEVWDLRKFRLLRSVPSLDQTMVTFNARGDVIYAILRRNLEDVMSAVHTRRVKHPLFAAFRTVDAVNYSDISTIPVDRCVLDFAKEPTDSFVGLITMDDQDEMYSSARIYEIGRRRPTDDDSDPDDAESEEEDEDDDDADVDSLLGPDLDGDADSDADDMSNDDYDDSVGDLDDDDDDDDDGDFMLEGGTGLLEIVTEGDEDEDDSELVESFSSDEDDFVGNGFGY
ncbi:hypothetical protein I3843_08G018000 [Carya illinoinensis]|uniref:Uncharacterized protein n=1 Tax=Carya illinoinensis TaxID=32201 RepID=A0A922J874_CARIL|nr:hypothetical protein I3842_08G017400 [Carya illinoinensis]KAG7965794.1 hypothetical protein I3843_08G018000 [Carya illinoinensis]